MALWSLTLYASTPGQFIYGAVRVQDNTDNVLEGG